MIPAAIPSAPSWRERSVAAIARRYPLKSGGPTIANSNIIKVLSGNRTVNLWAEVKGGKVLVPVNDLVGRTMYFCRRSRPENLLDRRSFCVPGRCRIGHRRQSRTAQPVLASGVKVGCMPSSLIRSYGPTWMRQSAKTLIRRL